MIPAGCGERLSPPRVREIGDLKPLGEDGEECVGTGEVGALEGEGVDGVGEGLVGVHSEVFHVLPDHVVEGLLRDRDRHFFDPLAVFGCAERTEGRVGRRRVWWGVGFPFPPL